MNYLLWPTSLLFIWGATDPGSARIAGQSGAPLPPRRYQAGPLTATDFRGEIPRQTDSKVASLLAFTRTEFRYSWKSTFTRRNRRHYLKATNIDLYCVILPQHSWNRAPQDRQLLDHEQGHFDITETHIRKAILKLREPAARKLFRASGNSRMGAVRRFEENLSRFMEPFVAASRKRHELYDRVTGHGTKPVAQQHERKRQKHELHRLAEQLRPRDRASNRSQSRPE